MKEHIKKIKKDIEIIKERIVIKTPTHFSWAHLAAAFIGALILGQTFVLKGLLYTVSYALTAIHIAAIILVTLFVLSIEIYYVGYRRVKKKEKRPFGQFWFKRISTYMIIAFLVSFGLIFLYNMDSTFIHTLKIAVAMSFPCAVGASLADLVERY